MSAISRNRPALCEVKSIDVEAEDTKTLKIRCESDFWGEARPGQFVMVWIPGVDEVPMSISNVAEGEVWITVKEVGEATSAIHGMTKGGTLGLRGPYGTSFTTNAKRALVVAGGIGAAPLLFLTRKLVNAEGRITLVLGARTAGKVVLRNDFGKLLRTHKNARELVTTDDGSVGEKGCASDFATALIREERFDHVYTCGLRA